ncbi:MAG: hypothetical protein P4M08_14355 [Oligoflexia bacterium]|nr:hypothetical protein [Oligoflexia bacterium]
MKYGNIRIVRAFLATLAVAIIVSSCASDRAKNQAKEAAARYWQDKAYPGKSFDVQVIEAEKTDGGYRVKGIVDGETRVGVFNPDTETFSEGYYSLAHEREKHIAELEQEVKYWKERTDTLEKENYRLKVQMSVATGGTGATIPVPQSPPVAPASVAPPAPVPAAPVPATPAAPEVKKP